MKTFVMNRADITYAHILTPFLNDITDSAQVNGEPTGRYQRDAIFTILPDTKADDVALASLLTFTIAAEPVNGGTPGSLHVGCQGGSRFAVVGADGSDHGSDVYYFDIRMAELMARRTFENYRWCNHVAIRNVYRAGPYEQHVTIEYGVMYAVAIAHNPEGTYRPMVERTTDWQHTPAFKADSGETVVHVGFVIFCENDQRRTTGLHWMSGKEAFLQSWAGKEDAEKVYAEAVQRGEDERLLRTLNSEGAQMFTGPDAKRLMQALFGGAR